MVVTLSGENAYTLSQELDKLVKEFIKNHSDLAIERLDAEETEFSKLREALVGIGLFSEKKLVIIHSASKNKEFNSEVEQLLNDIPDTTDLILIEPKLDKRLSFYKQLKKQTIFRNFAEPDQRELATWLSTKAKERDGILSQNDAMYLVERAGVNQQLLANELDKLLLYDSKISRSSIDLLTEAMPQSTIFQLLEAAFAGQQKRAMKLYEEQRAMKVEPPQIIAMLTWQLHVLAIIKAADSRSVDQIAQESKLNPYVLRKSQTIANKLSFSELKQLVKSLLLIDISMKRTNIDADDALQHYILSLAV